MALKRENILIVDDNYDMLEVLQRNLKALDYHVYKASSVKEALDILKLSAIDLLITDIQMPEVNGIELLKYAGEHYPFLPKLVITGFPSITSAVTAIQSGATDYLVKPFTSNELKNSVKKSLKNKLASPIQLGDKSVKDQDIPMVYAGIIGKSSSIQNVIESIERVKNNRATILIQGESGTGKELIARAIHYKGSFAGNPFIAVNCGAIPENLLESELFGYEKGAFTGANQNKEGFFQAANTGTIFLDEIGTAPASVQVKLLRVLQEKEVTKIGATKPQKIQIRIIAATNEDLYQQVQKGTFREDLYYRLNVVDIHVPNLHERKEDIPLLVQYFLSKYAKEYAKDKIQLSDRIYEIFERYPWPGNIRELENCIQKLTIMNEDQVDLPQLPKHFKYKIETTGKETFVPLEQMEKQYIQKVLSSVDNNKTKAAEILKINRKTLRSKLE
ncbi:sigma-54 dependent transcriptional regulator [Mesonia sp. K4-1]|uniref:sigma-54-dependent transcriptional regulator n=1 Tax=Mesonia sp. K4-1 TaxID=2602760 RepID=UPI0011C938FF|nr:sigma-54 dependent transcriptional regulator [Mesonia sp. K4-1]TXK76202.1 sigma-54-dependent Fis family transcriptional regulator [Mesonia sp. K4-1]